MLGMIFGVAAVIAMLSIGAGAQQQVIAFIEQLGVHNVIVEAREAGRFADTAAHPEDLGRPQLQDLRSIQSNVDGLVSSTARKKLLPTKLLPKPQGDTPVVYGVSPPYQQIAGLKVTRGRFFTDEEEKASAPVCVLGQAATAGLFGGSDPIGQFVKVNQQWFRVIGVAGPQLTAQADVAGLPAQDRNNLIYVPLSSAILRLEDSLSWQKDEIDAIYVSLNPSANVVSAGAVMRGLLDTSHHGASDFSVIVPAELLAEQERTKRLFEIVMVAIASISLTGRRHRHHEHHAGERHGADARDRRPPRHRRHAARHRPPVPGGNDDDHGHRRLHRDRRGHRPVTARRATSPAGPPSSA